MKSQLLKSAILSLGAVCMMACQNAEIEFPDNDLQTVYFAQQTPIRTITLGEDGYPTDLDNQGKCQIMAVLSGVYQNTKKRIIDVKIDNSLLKDVYFSNGEPVLELPTDYYQTSGSQITIPSGKIMGPLEISLNEKFFEDPKSVSLNYVIPVKMVSQTGADSILCGKAKEASANPLVETDWDILPKDYILYAVKYKNEYTGNWLSRNTMDITYGSNSVSVVNHGEYIENDKVVELSTISRKSCDYAVSQEFQVGENNYNLQYNVVVNYTESGDISLSSNTEGITINGSGKYTKLGEPKAWGNKDRDKICLDYTASGVLEGENFTVVVKDTLVARDRGSKFETFTIEVK